MTDGTKLYLRHKAFDIDLANTSGERDIIPTGGSLDGEPQHRTCWTLASSISTAIWGDILVSNGIEYYEVRGFPIYANHSCFDPRKNGYTLFAGMLDSPEASPKDAVKKRRVAGRKRGGGRAGKEMWRLDIPITGKAIAMAAGVLYVAGEPTEFDPPTYEKYIAAYNGQLGGRLLAVSATDGTKLAEYKLNAAPVWDSIAVANGQLYISLADGTV